MARIPLALALLASALLAADPSSASIGENLVGQWTFDEGIIGWDNLAGKRWEQIDDCRPLNEEPNPGSLEMLATDYVNQCVGIIGDEEYYISTFIKTLTTGDASAKTGISVVWHANSFCSAYIDGGITPFSYYFGATDWTKLEIVGKAPFAAHSAMVYLGSEKIGGTGDAEARARFDEVILAPLYGDLTTTTTTLDSVTTTTGDTTTTTDVPNAPGCGDPVMPYDTTTVADALFVLRRSVGAVICDNCFCDTDGSGSATTSDALRTLRIAVGQNLLKDCGGDCQYGL